MLKRMLELPKNRSFFLFGARNTGKSTLIQQGFPEETSLWLDLLEFSTEQRLMDNPDELYYQVQALPDNITHVVIDEVQKIPKLLDVVHRLITQKKKHFVLTGSSARKLKHGGANLLAGRAFVYHLFPFTHLELEDKFELEHALKWGTLPEVTECQNDIERRELLMAYTQTYLKEEIWQEQFIKALPPFRKFLRIAAQCNGKIINFSKIAREVGVDDKTVKSYFSILEDTLVGFFLEAHHNSVRKQINLKPKFYFFDTGVSRALAAELDIPMEPHTNTYGNSFEHFIITECLRIASYLRTQFEFSYLRTSNDNEIDLIIKRPGKPTVLIEIKSTSSIQLNMLTHFKRLSEDIPASEAYCFSNDPITKKFDHVLAIHWREGIQKVFFPGSASRLR